MNQYTYISVGNIRWALNYLSCSYYYDSRLYIIIIDSEQLGSLMMHFKIL